jgi:protease-4
MVFAIVLLVLLGISVLMNFGQFLSGFVPTPVHHMRTVGPKLEEVLLEDNSAANKIAIVPIEGIISSQLAQGGYNLVEVVKAQLNEAENDRRVKAVILKVDSPGGEVLASDEIYRLLADFQKKTGKPCVAAMGSVAASGGYYVSAPCQYIVANELTITGSIGVIMHSWNYRGLMNKVGLKPQVYKSGKFKDMLSGERDPEEIPPEESAMIQNLVNEVYEKFKSVVEEGRRRASQKNKDTGRDLNDNWKEYADGRVLSGNEALKLGFVDELGNFEDAVKAAQRIAGISSANLIEYQQRIDISDIFRLFGQSEAKTTVKVDLGLEAPKLQAGRLYYLSPTLMH